MSKLPLKVKDIWLDGVRIVAEPDVSIACLCGASIGERHRQDCSLRLRGNVGSYVAEPEAFLSMPLAEVHAREHRLKDDLQRVKAERDGAHAEVARLTRMIASLGRAQETSAKAADAVYRDARKALGDDPDLTVAEMATNIRGVLDEVTRFLAGMNLQDQPLGVQKARAGVVHRAIAAVKPVGVRVDKRAIRARAERWNNELRCRAEWASKL